MKTPKEKQIGIWIDDNMSNNLDPEFLSLFLPDTVHLTVVSTYRELFEFCQSEPLGIIIADSQLVASVGPFEALQSRFPNILRFLWTQSNDLAALEKLFNANLIHKYINSSIPIEVFRLQIQEMLAILHLFSERNAFLELSITDPVTQLTNHRFFQQKFRQELQKAKVHKESLSLLMLDVDHFKLLNDQYGHPQGDTVLNLIAREIKKHIPMFASASRYGGEEFAVVLPKCNSKNAFSIAENIRLAITQLKNLDFRLSASIGVACYPEHGLDKDEILGVADHALYCAKRQGRNMTIVAGDGAY